MQQNEPLAVGKRLRKVSVATARPGQRGKEVDLPGPEFF